MMNFYNTKMKKDAKKLQSIICLKIMFKNSFSNKKDSSPKKFVFIKLTLSS